MNRAPSLLLSGRAWNLAVLVLAATNLDVLGAGRSMPRRDIVGTEKSLYSQSQEEVIVRDFFQDRRDGVFLDVGCASPVTNSNTYYLEHHLGWTGIGIV